MQITTKQRDEQFDTASDAIQHLYSSNESGKFLFSIFEKHKLDESLYKTYVNTVGDIILGFYPVTSLASELQKNLQIDESAAKNITSDLIDFLSPVIENESNPTNENSTTPVAGTQQPETSTPEPTPAVPESTVQPLRTMENDMDKIHGYGAYRKMYPDPQVESAIPDAPESAGGEEGVVRATSQDETLKKPPTLTETPTYEEGE